jgi:hypothetical protein
MSDVSLPLAERQWSRRFSLGWYGQRGKTGLCLRSFTRQSSTGNVRERLLSRHPFTAPSRAPPCDAGRDLAFQQGKEGVALPVGPLSSSVADQGANKSRPAHRPADPVTGLLRQSVERGAIGRRERQAADQVRGGCFCA